MRIGAVFGTVEGTAPLIGWMLGNLASGFIEAVDHWIAFAILAAIGGKMIYEALQPASEDAHSQTHSLKLLFITACGTSVDLMAAGASLALKEVNIWLMAALIALATFAMSTLGIMAVHVIGDPPPIIRSRIYLVFSVCAVAVFRLPNSNPQTCLLSRS